MINFTLIYYIQKIVYTLKTCYQLTLSRLSASFFGKNEPFLLENASNLTYQLLYENFNNDILFKFSCVKFDAFSRRNGSFFPQKQGAEKGKC